ncbi:uncharacterized protein EI97DRAFT_433643 [Westerdykella ornata]|uniref:Uncharacterized protein n=1 Tax=Westerdykella ornata TaxID=318751 RepID=A0A6A6JMS7_WESOR|nr:uncharacterized protein EI97DRAFT_433643 [Westerdykella ornata]KAF2276239.1 hypothetical protein EI97DRAFT_433643 [Westerdykella ornata]
MHTYLHWQPFSPTAKEKRISLRELIMFSRSESSQTGPWFGVPDPASRIRESHQQQVFDPFGNGAAACFWKADGTEISHCVVGKDRWAEMSSESGSAQQQIADDMGISDSPERVPRVVVGRWTEETIETAAVPVWIIAFRISHVDYLLTVVDSC